MTFVAAERSSGRLLHVRAGTHLQVFHPLNTEESQFSLIVTAVKQELHINLSIVTDDKNTRGSWIWSWGWN